ncbi:MAG: STAS domain-containing protein [Gammaproteobacteria bacterium]|nr:STAS domain-containing protein [Gammaproteobacteria bacterium]MCF6363734.1 STAS domain-containing protein [Gammaproteobacteria bacterium]
MGITTQLSEQGDQLNIVIAGRFDFSLHAEFRDAYRNLPSDTKFIIDLSQTIFMDSSAMGMLLLLREFAGEESADIQLLNCSQEVRKVLSISNLDKMFSLV